MAGVSKSFDGNKVLTDVNFTVEENQIHALLGENGAGKSTLLNILAGVLSSDAGSVLFDGTYYSHPSITTMEKAGLAFVHQELNVINDLTVSENIFFNHELTFPLGILKTKQMITRTRELFDQLSVDIDPTVKVSQLSTSQKQFLEIARALHMDAKLMILDEPTTALGNDEIDQLFTILRELRDRGRSFIFVSHKIPEVFQIADTYTVLRNGELISTGPLEGMTPFDITLHMVGEQYASEDLYTPRDLGEVVLHIDHLTSDAFRDINLEVRRGEVVALTGLAGSGASELMQALFGAYRINSGEVLVESKKTRGSISRFMKRSVAMLPTNRKENSVVPDFSVLDNMVLAEHNLSVWPQWISTKRETARYEAQKKSLAIKASSPHMSITSLSGGNQQKVFLGRWLNTEAEILLLDNPTQGVDVGAKEEIYALILQLATQGKTILINTLEIAEIQKVSDRCVVLYSGEVVALLDHHHINERDVMLYSTNAIPSQVSSQWEQLPGEPEMTEAGEDNDFDS